MCQWARWPWNCIIKTLGQCFVNWDSSYILGGNSIKFPDFYVRYFSSMEDTILVSFHSWTKPKIHNNITLKQLKHPMWFCSILTPQFGGVHCIVLARKPWCAGCRPGTTCGNILFLLLVLTNKKKLHSHLTLIIYFNNFYESIKCRQRKLPLCAQRWSQRCPKITWENKFRC